MAMAWICRPGKSASTRDLAVESMTMSFEVELEGLPPPVYRLPFESEARAHRYAMEGSPNSRNTGDNVRRPSLLKDRFSSVPFSKSVWPECTQLLVSTAPAIRVTRKRAHDAMPGAVCGRKVRIM